MVRVYRPRQQRVARVLLAFALLLPAAAFFQAIGVTKLTIGAASVLGICSLALAFGAVRPVLIVGRHGLGVVGLLPGEVHWLTWPEISELSTEGAVVALTTTGKMIYHVQIDARAADLVRRMVAKHAL